MAEVTIRVRISFDCEEYKNLCFRHAAILSVTEGKNIVVSVEEDDSEYYIPKGCPLCELPTKYSKSLAEEIEETEIKLEDLLRERGQNLIPSPHKIAEERIKTSRSEEFTAKAVKDTETGFTYISIVDCNASTGFPVWSLLESCRIENGRFQWVEMSSKPDNT